MQENLKNTEKLKKELELHQKNKILPWTIISNIIIEKLNEKESFEDFFYELS